MGLEKHANKTHCILISIKNSIFHILTVFNVLMISLVSRVGNQPRMKVESYVI